LSYREDTLHCVHTINNGLLPGQHGSKAQGKANALRMGLVKKQMADEEIHGEFWTLSKKQRKRNGG
jgi:hypothetical protein